MGNAENSGIKVVTTTVMSYLQNQASQIGDSLANAENQRNSLVGKISDTQKQLDNVEEVITDQRIRLHHVNVQMNELESVLSQVKVNASVEPEIKKKEIK